MNITTMTETILSTLKTWPTSQGWHELHSGECIDMCFRIVDESSTNKESPNEFHCYLTFDFESKTYNGYFGYWTPNDGLPTNGSKAKFEDLVALYKLESVDSFPDEILQQLKTSVIEFAAHTLFNKENIGELEFDKALKHSEYKDWYVWQWNDDYIDIENEFTVSGEPEDSDRHSINIHVTFSPDQKRSYIMLGDNEGDGFNDLKEFDGDIDSTIAKIEHAETKAIFEKHRDECHRLVEEAKEIIKRYPWAIFAV